MEAARIAKSIGASCTRCTSQYTCALVDVRSAPRCGGRCHTANLLHAQRRIRSARLAPLCRETDCHGQVVSHCLRVGRLAGLLAREVGVDEATAVLIERAARLHDVGKVSVACELLLKPAQLTEAELQVIRQHTVSGEQLLRSDAASRMRSRSTSFAITTKSGTAPAIRTSSRAKRSRARRASPRWPTCSTR
jgi:putative nucleotidyltransferase with HDIG domain